MSSSPLSPAPSSSSSSTSTAPPPAAASPPPSSSAPPPASASPPTTPPSSPPVPSTTTSPPPASSPPSPSPPAPPPSSPPPPPASASSPAPSASTSTPASSSPPPPPKNVPSPTSNSSTTAATPPPPSSVATASPPPPTSSTLKSPPPPRASTSSSPTPTTPSSASSSISSGTLTAIAVAGVLALSVVLILAYCLCCRKKKRNNYYLRPSGDHYAAPPAPYKDAYYDLNLKQPGSHSSHSQSSDILLNLPPPPPPPPPRPPASEHELVPQGVGNGSGSRSWFTYAELATATNGFSKANMLGEGGFGCVYKGVLSNGQVVAVKQLKSGASQGEKQFQAEVEIISRVHHRHLVSLVGYCISESQRLLVYDYVPNNTLEYHLHKRKDGSVMDWSTRMKVASGAARGLAYLHEDCHPRIIHRDIKSANILLDNNFEAQVADFGLAKLTSDLNTHVTTRVMGTFGYLAPEYASSGKLTEKSDVFSFGVVLLELATGRKPVDPSQPPGEESLVEWARPTLAQVEREEDLKLVADPLLKGLYDSGEMMRMVEAAAACVRYSANKRPRMGQVVRALEDDSSLSDLSKGLKPGYSRGYGSSFSSNDYENGSYSTDMRKFRQMLNESGVSINQSVSSSSGFQTSMEMEHRSSERPVPAQRNMQSGSSNEFSAGSRSNG